MRRSVGSVLMAFLPKLVLYYAFVTSAIYEKTRAKTSNICDNHNYTIINDTRRSTSNPWNDTRDTPICDRTIIKDSLWYRFEIASGNQLPTTRPKLNHCGTYAPIWMNGSHPTVSDGVVSRTACASLRLACQYFYRIKVLNCSGFYVYQLKPPDHCYLAYCIASNQTSSTTQIPPTAGPTRNVTAPTPDIDECNWNPKVCHSNANCSNVHGFFLCQCRLGYAGDGKLSCEDINECLDPDQYACRKGYDCANTVGSYECVCNGLKEDDGQCIVLGFTSQRLQLRLNENYTNALAINTSEAYKAMESGIQSAMRTVYQGIAGYEKVEVRQFMAGSIIADMELTFADTYTTGLLVLANAIRNNSFGNFDVDEDALTVVITGSCGSYDCPGNSSCEQLSENTLSCPCNEGFYFNGIKCLEFINIKVELALESEFTEELNNNSSPLYIELKRNITEELFETFKDTPNFQEVIVTGFRNGSIIVEFIVKYLQDPELNTKVVVAEELKKEIIRTGKIGNLKLKEIKIKGTPPPPANLTHTGVTETRIDLSWNKPVGYDLFVIDGYSATYKALSEKDYKTKEIDPSLNNFAIQGLESETFYQITVHGYNSEGIGDKEAIQVKTDKSPSDKSSVAVIIIIVVIVAVVFIIICIVVFFQLRKRRRLRQARKALSRKEGGTENLGMRSISTHDNDGQKHFPAGSSKL